VSKVHIHRVDIGFGDCDLANPTRIRAIPIPEDIKALCL
jgi:hypothetical protein